MPCMDMHRYPAAFNRSKVDTELANLKGGFWGSTGFVGFLGFLGFLGLFGQTKEAKEATTIRAFLKLV